MAKSASPPPVAAVNGFLPLNHANTEVVLCADVDKYGMRLVTGSADHRLRVFELDEKTGEWELVDAWRGHHGMILDVRFSPLPSASMPLLASTGDDLKLKIWAHDPTVPRASGRRFYTAFSQSAAHSVAYSSLAFAALAPSDLYLALITRDGLLSLLEPVPDQESNSTSGAATAGPTSATSSTYPYAGATPYPISPPNAHHKARGQDWRELDQFYVCDGPVGRGTETNFRLAFQDSPRPNYHALAAGLHPRALSLAVSALGDVRVYRILPATRGAEGYRFQAPCAVLTGPRGLVRDVAWSPAAFRSSDLIASAAADGIVRVYELSVPKQPRGAPPDQPKKPQPTSGIGAGLASASERDLRAVALLDQQHGTQQTPASPVASNAPVALEPGQVRHEVRLLAELPHDGVWRVAWLKAGAALTTTGDSGRSRVWAPSQTGKWLEFAEFGPDTGEEDEDKG